MTRTALLTLLAVLLLTGCKPKIPHDYIQPAVMEDILYDLHLAESLQQSYGDRSDTLALLSYQANILRKHGVSQAEFDSSMVYYARHTKKLHEIYLSLAERLNNEAIAQGASASNLSQYGSLSSSSDTTDVWTGDRSFVLTPHATSNKYSFELKVDTAYHQGDRLMLDFDTQFIYQDGMRDLVAVVSITYDNDSTATQTIHSSSSAHSHLQVGDPKLTVKRIRGFFLLANNAYNQPSTTLRLLVVSNVRLVRMHRSEDEPQQPTDTITAKPQPLPDTDKGPAVRPQPAIDPDKHPDAALRLKRLDQQ